MTASRRADLGLLSLAALASLAALLFLGVSPVSAATPTATIEPASAVTYTTATAEGTVDPADHETSYRFQYVSEEKFLASEWTEAESVGLGSLAEGAGPTPVEAQLSALRPGTTYHLRLLAENSEAETAEAIAPTFTTKAVAKPTVSIEAVTAFTARTAHLVGHVNPDAPGAAPQDPAFDSTWHFECTPVCPGLSGGTVAADDTGHEVAADTTGLVPGTTYEVTLTAENAGGTETAGPVAFTTPLAAPGPSAPSFTGVTDSSATLGAEVDPGGAATTAHFEYVTQAQFAAEGFANPGRTTDVSVGSGTTAVPIGATLSGLAPATTYLVRVVASNSVDAEAAGGKAAFTTQGTFAGLLPDNRQWQLVSPPDKHGAPLAPISYEGAVIEAAANGEAITYAAKGPITAAAAGNRSFANSQILSRRDSSAWRSEEITTPHEAVAGLSPNVNSEYRLFSPDLSVAGLEPQGATPLAPGASEATPYLRRADGTYVPLVTAANVPEGVKFGGTEVEPGIFAGSPQLVTANPDASVAVISSESLLSSEFPPGFEPPEIGEGTFPANVYRWQSGQLRLISQIPSAGGARCGGSAPPCIPAAAEGLTSRLGNQGVLVRNAISEDGGRAVFESFAGTSPHLYLRDLDRHETIDLGIPDPAGESGTPGFFDASVDDSKIFFTDTGDLTGDSPARSGEPNLYECEVDESEGHLACTLRNLSVDLNAGERAAVPGVIGSDRTGRYVYFAAAGVLASGAAVGNCEKAAANSCNLYLADTVAHTTRLVAVLPDDDFRAWEAEGNRELSRLAARVSPNGRYLAFMSRRPLTGYDNRDAATGAPDEEVFLYDAEGEGGLGKLVCASCNPTGARPHGIFRTETYPGPLVDRVNLFENRTLAGSLPGWTPSTGREAVYQSRYLSDGGRLFFNAADSLVPQDSNSTEDVYEYEPPAGTGQPTSNTCSVASPTYSPSSGGCVNLISSGASGEESAFMDASESGDDVFFLTAARLSPLDTDSAYDLYDAHACTTGSPCLPDPVPVPTPCSGEGCQVAAPAPTEVSAATATFDGPGNPRPRCAKGKVKKGGRCVARKHSSKKKHNKKKNKKSKRAAANNRGGGR